VSGGKRIVTRRDVDALKSGDSITIDADTVVTPFAREQAQRRGIRIVESAANAGTFAGESPPRPPVSAAGRPSARVPSRPPVWADSPAPAPATSASPAFPQPAVPPEVRAWLDAGGRMAPPAAEPPKGYEAIQLRRPLPPPPKSSGSLPGVAGPSGALPKPSPMSSVPPSIPPGSPPATHPAIQAARSLRDNDGHLPDSGWEGVPYTGREHLTVPIRLVGRCGVGIVPRLLETLEGFGCRIVRVDHRTVQDYYEATVLVDLHDSALDLATLHQKVQELQRPGECHVSVHAMAARSNPAPDAYEGA